MLIAERGAGANRASLRPVRRTGARLLNLVVVTILVVGSGCRAPDGSVARVGERSIPVEAFQDYLESVTGESWQTVDEKVASRLLDQFLDQEAVLAVAGTQAEAVASGAPDRRGVIVQRLLSETCGEQPRVEQARVDAEVERRLAGAVRQPGVRLRQMLLDDRAAAGEVRRRLDAGEDWLVLSREVSRSPNADDGGEVGLVRKGSLPEAFEGVVFALQPGEISAPVQGPSGYHVFQVLQTDPGGPVARDELAAHVLRELERAASREFVRSCLDRIAAEVGVSVDRRLLWFRYDGRYAEE